MYIHNEAVDTTPSVPSFKQHTWSFLLSSRGSVAGGARGDHGPSYRQDPSENWKFDILSEFEFLRSSFSLYYAILIYEREIYFSTM